MAPWFAGVYPRGRPCLPWHRRYEITKCRRITANLRYGFSLSLSLFLLTSIQATAARDLRAKRRLTISAVSPSPWLRENTLPNFILLPRCSRGDKKRDCRLFLGSLTNEHLYVCTCLIVCLIFFIFIHFLLFKKWSYRVYVSGLDEFYSK